MEMVPLRNKSRQLTIVQKVDLHKQHKGIQGKTHVLISKKCKFQPPQLETETASGLQDYFYFSCTCSNRKEFVKSC